MMSNEAMFPPHFYKGAPPPFNYKIIQPPVVVPIVVREAPIDTTSCCFHFRQQTLRPWYPIPTLCTSFILLIALGIFMVALGIVMQVESNSLKDFSVRYDTNCPTIGVTCTAVITIPENVRGPVFVYYGLRNFYQNHRLFSRSKKDRQWFGSLYTVEQQDGDCSPIIRNSDLNNGQGTISIAGTPLDPSGPVNPCGLTSMTVFNDTYTLAGPSGAVGISNNDIAWKGDQEKFKITDPTVMWTDTTDERFQNWVRVASRSEFRKLWGRIDSDLPAGTYTFTIANNYDVSSINGQKSLALANANNFGGKNDVLAGIYLAIGSLFLLLGLLVSILWCLRRRQSVVHMI